MSIQKLLEKKSETRIVERRLLCECENNYMLVHYSDGRLCKLFEPVSLTSSSDRV